MVDCVPSTTDVLTKCCRYHVRQCMDILMCMDGDVFTSSVEGNSSIGAHFRHIYDRFSCFLLGMDKGVVDYDKRERNAEIEQDIATCRDVYEQLYQRLDGIDSRFDTTCLVYETVQVGCKPVCVPSSFAREMHDMMLHTVHHCAMIRMLATMLGAALPEDFGKASSTILFEQELEMAS